MVTWGGGGLDGGKGSFREEGMQIQFKTTSLTMELVDDLDIDIALEIEVKQVQGKIKDCLVENDASY